MSDPVLIQPSCGEIYAECHFDHCCNCSEFDVSYEIFSDDGTSNGQEFFGSVDVSGCDDVYDEITGRKLIISRNKCFSEIKFTCEATTASDKKFSPFEETEQEQNEETCGDVWEEIYGNSNHDGLSIKFTDENGQELSDIEFSTQQPVIIKYCEIYSGTSSAP